MQSFVNNKNSSSQKFYRYKNQDENNREKPNRLSKTGLQDWYIHICAIYRCLLWLVVTPPPLHLVLTIPTLFNLFLIV